MEKFSIWSHSQKTSQLVLVTTINHQIFVANGQRLRTLLFDVFDLTTINSMMVLLLMSTLTKCTNMTSKYTICALTRINALPCTINIPLTHYKRTTNALKMHSFDTKNPTTTAVSLIFISFSFISLFFALKSIR